MSIEQYQNAVNRLDKEIADLEAKRAEAELKAVREEGNAANIRFNKFDSKSLIDSKNRQQKRHMDEAQKARKKAAEFSRSIAEKQKRRNSAYLNLQSEQKRTQKREQNNPTDIWLRALDTHVLPQNESVCESAEYDVFVSYAHEDKAFANELVCAFRKRGIRVWFDSSEIGWGDSIRTKIDEGLNKSRYGIVILTADYIKDGKYWTKTELEGLLQVESVNGKRILPIWHNLTKEQVIEFSPTVAQRSARSTANFTIDEIAEELEQLLRANKKEESSNE